MELNGKLLHCNKESPDTCKWRRDDRLPCAENNCLMVEKLHEDLKGDRDADCNGAERPIWGY